MRYLILHIILLFFTGTTLFSQSYSIESGLWGLFGDINRNHHISNFTSLPNIPNCCPSFTAGVNEKFAGTFGFHLPLGRNVVLRPSLMMWDGTLRYNEYTKGGIAGQIVDVQIGHSIESKIRSFGSELLYIISLGKRFETTIGGRIDYVYQANYVQQEQLLQPSAVGAWNNGINVRNRYEGKLPNAQSYALTPSVGVHFTFPLTKAESILLSPEFIATYNVVPVIADYEWNVLALRFGCAVIFNKKEILDTNFQSITPPIKITDKPLKIPTCEILIKGIGPGGDLNDLSAITINQIEKKRQVPLLPFVFFNDNQYDIPSRYIQTNNIQTEIQKINSFSNESKLEIYWNILNIVGERLQKHPESKITLIGCNADYGKEKGNRELSKKRAEIIRDYLRNIWSIPQDRITLQYRNLPNEPSRTTTGNNQDIIDSREENRRVEMYSDHPSILAPVQITIKSQIIEPTSIQLIFPEQSQDSTFARTIEVQSYSDSSSTLLSDEYTKSINPSINVSKIGLYDDTLSLKSTSFNKNSPDLKCSSSYFIPIERKITQIINSNDSISKEYSLVLFPFNTSGIGIHNQRILDEIRSFADSGMHILIQGYTDRVGRERYNHKLSYKRAEAVSKVLRKRDNQIDNTSIRIEGMGEQDLQELPESRLYWRTVNIYLTNPKE